jgi:solute carrier family 35, member E1
MTLSTLQLVVGFVLSIFQFAFYSGFPSLSFDQYIMLLASGACSAGAHAASVFAMALGGVAFGQVVKAAEPCFAALIGGLFYGKKTPIQKIFCFIPMVGGVFLCCLKEKKDGSKGVEITIPMVGEFVLDYSLGGLIAACIANTFAAFKGNENKKVLEGTTPEVKALKSALGDEGLPQQMNQFAIMNFVSMMVSIPLVFLKEGFLGDMVSMEGFGNVIPDFYDNASRVGSLNIIEKQKPPKEDKLYSTGEGYYFDNIGLEFLIISGIAFYVYNLAVLLSLKKLDAVTQSVLNTAKRVVVIVFAVIVRGETKEPIEIAGCVICMIGVGMYALIDAQIKEAGKLKKT